VKRRKSSIGRLSDRPCGDDRPRARPTEQDESARAVVRNHTGFDTLVAIIGFVVLIGPGVAHGQVEGAVQYPPLSIGDDAQPPPPARMVPQLVLPRRLEFGVSGSSLPPLQHPYQIHPVTDRLPGQPAPLSGASPVPPPTRSGSD